MKPKILILLSSKCSGSSAFQKYLQENFDAQVLELTGHHENESLFYTKAASILGLPQKKMHRSKVPYSKEQARKEINELLKNNDSNVSIKKDTEIEVFEAFKSLALIKQPLFVEKSPHHLYNLSNIELIIKFASQFNSDFDIYIFGLVRNPLDTIYSAWKRWRFNCLKFEFEWSKSYSNLLGLKQIHKELHILRYEDIVADSSYLDNILLEQSGLHKCRSNFLFNSKSVGKWKGDETFRHVLGKETKLIAQALKYESNDLQNSIDSSGVYWNILELKNAARYFFVDMRRIWFR